MGDTGRDPFAVLGLPRDATAADARRAFRLLARATHPDHGGDATAFREVLAAFRTVERRAPRRRPTPYDAALLPPPAIRSIREPGTGGRPRPRPRSFADELAAAMRRVAA